MDQQLREKFLSISESAPVEAQRAKDTIGQSMVERVKSYADLIKLRVEQIERGDNKRADLMRDLDEYAHNIFLVLDKARKPSDTILSPGASQNSDGTKKSSSEEASSSSNRSSKKA